MATAGASGAPALSYKVSDDDSARPGNESGMEPGLSTGIGFGSASATSEGAPWQFETMAIGGEAISVVLAEDVLAAPAPGGFIDIDVRPNETTLVSLPANAAYSAFIRVMDPINAILTNRVLARVSGSAVQVLLTGVDQALPVPLTETVAGFAGTNSSGWVSASVRVSRA